MGSVGKHEQFDMNFMPLSRASAEKWKRIDRAFRLGQELPPVSLLEQGGDYFVNDGNNRVSVARFHGVEWIDAQVTGGKSVSTRPPRRALDAMRWHKQGLATPARGTLTQCRIAREGIRNPTVNGTFKAHDRRHSLRQAWIIDYTERRIA